MFKNTSLHDYDYEIFAAIDHENRRQEDHIELIASENYASPQVMMAQGSQLTNKYAEGYAGKRYYGGCEYVDVVENIAIERCKKLFNVGFANVQPHSGSSANAAVFLALLNAGDTVLGMSLAEGGHLTHGAKVNFSGKLYNAESYGINEAGFIDYDALEEKALMTKPKMIIAGFSAYSGILDWARFRKIADRVNAFLLADIAHVAGLVATGIYPSPVGFADVITTTTHKSLRGPRSGLIMTNDEALAKKLNSAVFPGYQGGPLMHVIAAKAIAFGEALQPEFKTYQEQVVKNAKVMAQRLIERGIDIISGGTQNHLMLVSLLSKGLTGKQIDASLGRAHITVNKNAVPNDTNSPFVTGGIRLGTPAITTRGFKEAESVAVADMVADIIDAEGAETSIIDVRKRAAALCAKFPVYPH
ncbi:MAG: glycine hydroxymethyltransferase [Alphaproteobacteria bacterium]|jgi:glycine hydroxymethyltransferase